MNKLRIAMAGLAVLLASLPCHATEQQGITTQHPAMSPNSADIAFSSDATGARNIWIAGADGTRVRRLTVGTGDDDDPAWSPDGTTIAFTHRSGDTADIWSVKSDGTQLRQLTSNSLRNSNPAWSPDGQKLAFVSNRGGTNDIWVMPSAGGAPSRVTTLTGQENNPSFSPAGNQLVFSETANGAASLMIANLDGSGVQTLTSGNYQDWRPNWSRFGIAFSSNRTNGASAPTWRIWVIQSDGTGLRQLSRGAALDPSWTPSGAIVYSNEFSHTPALSWISTLNTADGSKTPILQPSFAGDMNGDGIIDVRDLAIIQAALNKPAVQPYDARDRNGDGRIDALDLRILTNLCTYDRCASTP